MRSTYPYSQPSDRFGKRHHTPSSSIWQHGTPRPTGRPSASGWWWCFSFHPVRTPPIAPDIFSSGWTKLNSFLFISWLLLDAEYIGSDGCDTEWSKTWSNAMCVERGICNVPCRDEGFDNGTCKKLIKCLCSINCGDGLQRRGFKPRPWPGCDGHQVYKVVCVILTALMCSCIICCLWYRGCTRSGIECGVLGYPWVWRDSELMMVCKSMFVGGVI
jgi:hypothetical protein